MRKRPGRMVTEPQQLTLWPDDALPGQLPLFNRKAAVGVLSEDVSRYCERCETVIAAFQACRGTLSPSNPPAAEPIWEPDDWFGKRPPMEIVPAASTYL